MRSKQLIFLFYILKDFVKGFKRNMPKIRRHVERTEKKEMDRG